MIADVQFTDARVTSSTSPFNIDIPTTLGQKKFPANSAFRALVEVVTYNTALSSYTSYQMFLLTWAYDSGWTLSKTIASPLAITSTGTAAVTPSLPSPPNNDTMRFTLTPIYASSTQIQTRVSLIAYDGQA